MRLTVIGCSGTVPGPDSPASCYLVEADDAAGHGEQRTWRVVLDLGSGAIGALQRYTDPMALDAVLLSHLHPDHCMDLCSLYVMLKYAPGPRPRPRVAVWGPSGTAERMARAYGMAPVPGMSAQLDVVAWDDGSAVVLGPLTITPMRVEHPVEAYGLRVEERASGAVLAYTGDTDACAALSALCADADLMLADAAFLEGHDQSRGVHLSARRAGEAATAAEGVRRLVLTHLPPWNPGDVALAQARASWDGELDLARSGATYDVRATHASH